VPRSASILHLCHHIMTTQAASKATINISHILEAMIVEYKACCTPRPWFGSPHDTGEHFLNHLSPFAPSILRLGMQQSACRAVLNHRRAPPGALQYGTPQNFYTEILGCRSRARECSKFKVVRNLIKTVKLRVHLKSHSLDPVQT
jgi:hypothetical protein